MANMITLKQLLHRPSPGGPISPADPLPVRQYGGDGEAADPATEKTLGEILTKLSSDPATETGQSAISQAIATLADVISTKDKQNEIISALGTLGTETTLGLIKVALDTLAGKDFATSAKQDAAKAVLDAIAGKDFATQTTLASILTKLSDLARESTLGVVKTAAETLAETVADGAQKVTLTGQIEVLAELENVDVPANSIVDIVPRGIRIGYTEVRGGFYVNGAVSGNYELRIRNLQPQANSHHPYSYRTIAQVEGSFWESGRSLGIESVRWGVEFRNLNDFDITLRSVVVMGVR